MLGILGYFSYLDYAFMYPYLCSLVLLVNITKSTKLKHADDKEERDCN